VDGGHASNRRTFEVKSLAHLEEELEWLQIMRDVLLEAKAVVPVLADPEHRGLRKYCIYHDDDEQSPWQHSGAAIDGVLHWVPILTGMNRWRASPLVGS